MQQKSKPYEGFFLTIEGGDGSGKGTLANALVKELISRGYDVVKTREPGGSPLSEKIRTLLLTPGHTIGEHAELLLFLAARAQHIEEVILPALRQKKIVLCERFNDSSIAYQGCARHLGMHTVEQLCALATDNLVPQLTLLLDLSPEEGLKRLQKERATDRLEQEHLQFHTEVRQGYLHLADQYPERIFIIDAQKSPEEVLAASLAVLESHLLLKP